MASPPTCSNEGSQGRPLLKEPNILDYTMGKPRRINSSHFGNVELYVCLQEDALFLPTRAGGRSRRRMRSVPREQDAEADADRELAPPEATPPEALEVTEVNNELAADSATDPRSFQYSGTPENESGPVPYSEIDSDAHAPTATLRGSVLLKLTKPTKIKEIGVSFYCVGRTVWNLVPQPSVLVDTPLPSSAEVEDVAYLGIHHWDFVPLEHFGQCASSYNRATGSSSNNSSGSDQSATLIGQDLWGADTAILKDSPGIVRHRKFTRMLHNSATKLRGMTGRQIPVFSPSESQPRKLKHPSVQVDGTTFPAGEYVYHFSLLVDSSTPESVDVPNGHVKFFVMPRVVRSGPFAPNIQGKVGVEVVRSPPEPSDSLGNDHVLLSRIWDDRLVYSLNLERKFIALDTSTKLVLSLLPIPGFLVEVHQVRVYLLEIVSYLYSLDASVRSSDASLRLLLYQKSARPDPDNPKQTGNLLHPTEPTEMTADLPLVTQSDEPIQNIPQSYGRGRFGEKRFLQPDVRGPYIRVKHRLVVMLRLSRANSQGTRSHFEVKIDTPVMILSKFCVSESVHLPVYGSEFLGEDLVTEMPPSFDDALSHELVSPPCAPSTRLDKPPR